MRSRSASPLVRKRNTYTDWCERIAGAYPLKRAGDGRSGYASTLADSTFEIWRPSDTNTR